MKSYYAKEDFVIECKAFIYSKIILFLFYFWMPIILNYFFGRSKILELFLNI